jgi:hypothetical protein
MDHLRKPNLKNANKHNRTFSDTITEIYMRVPEDLYLNIDTRHDCLFDFSGSDTVVGEHVRSLICQTGVPFVFNKRPYIKTIHRTPTHCVEKTGVLCSGTVFVFKLKYTSIENPTKCETYLYTENIAYIRSLHLLDVLSHGRPIVDDDSLLIPSVLATLRDVLFKLNMRTSSGSIEKFIYRVMSHVACLERTYSNILVTPDIYDIFSLRETVNATLESLFSECDDNVCLYRVPEPCVGDTEFMWGLSAYSFDTIKKKRNICVETHECVVDTSDQTTQIDISEHNREYLYAVIERIQKLPYTNFKVIYGECIEVIRPPSQHFELTEEHNLIVENIHNEIKKYITRLDISRMLSVDRVVVERTITDILTIRIYSNKDVYGLCIDLNSTALNSRSLTYI